MISGNNEDFAIGFYYNSNCSYSGLLATLKIVYNLVSLTHYVESSAT